MAINPKIRQSTSNLLLLIAFLEGFSVIGIELSSHRIIAPVFGTNVLIWVTLLSVTTLCLALGYYLGSILIKTKKNISIFHILTFTSIWLSACILSLPYIYGILDSSDKYILSSLVLELLLFFVPLTLFGLLPTLAIHNLKHTKNNSGKISSHVFFISTLGAILGCYFFGFWGISTIGVKNSLLLIAFVIIIPALMIRTKKLIHTINIIAAILFLSLNFYLLNQKKEKENILYSSEGLLGQIIVGDFKTAYNSTNETDRILFVNRMGQTWIDNIHKESRWEYVNYIQATLSKLPRGSNVLLLGLGGGTVADKLYKKSGFNLDAVEIDGRIKNVAHNYFDLTRNINIKVDDARHYINSNTKKYDAIIVDLFKGEVPPAHVLSIECFRDINSILKSNGIMIVNFNGFTSGKKGIVGRSLYKTLERAGYFVNILPTGHDETLRNNLYIATNKPMNFEKNIALINGEAISISSLFITPKLNDGFLILSDDKPKLEYLNIELGQFWRKSYQENFNKEFEKMGMQEVY